jgi:hypothetical protein
LSQIIARAMSHLYRWCQWVSFHAKGTARLMREHVHHAIVAGVFNGPSPKATPVRMLTSYVSSGGQLWPRH